jgi:DNA-binding MarR family transcriptional regulator
MRRGYDKSRKLLRLGMPAMFTAITLATSPLCGQNITELAERTGRTKSDLRHVLKRLKEASIVREVSRDVYRLTDDFQAQYERELQQSGVTQVERAQRRQHEEDRKRRDERLPVVKQPTPLRGPDQVQRIMNRDREEGRQENTEAKPPDEERIKGRIGQGMSPKWARAEVLSEAVF